MYSRASGSSSDVNAVANHGGKNVTLVRIGAGGSISQAQLLADKRSMVSQAEEGDCLLLVRRGRHQPDVIWVDNVAVACEALEARSSREPR
jgi:hypothetical protein